VLDLTPVGSYTGSASPYGTFDQGGNVTEWNEAVSPPAWRRKVRGGSYLSNVNQLAAVNVYASSTVYQDNTCGFRVASRVSAPPVPTLSPVAVALLAAALGGLGIVGVVITARRRLS